MNYQIVNYIKRPRGRRHLSRLGSVLTVLLLIIILGHTEPAQAQTQWTTPTNQADLYNTGGGNVGIGTTAPSTGRIHIAGNNTSAGGFPLIKIENTQTGGNTYWLYAGAGGIPGDFGIYNATTGLYGFYLKGNSNVGIGTANPSAKLHSISTTEPLRIGYSTTHYATFVVGSTGNLSITPTSGYTFISGLRFNPTDALVNQIYQSNLNTTLGITANGGDISFGQTSTQQLIVKPSGNVGIGTTTPGYKLDVGGTINATAIYQNGVPFSSGNSQWATNGSNISYSSGNVGIGTTSPGYKLDVGGTINATAIYQNGSPLSSSQWTTSASNISYNTGNVGIGTTTPGYKLDVGGTINATAIYQNGSPFSSSQWTTSGSNISYSSGNIGVGTTSPDSRFHIQGAAQLSSFTGTSRGVLTISAPYTNLYHTALDFNYADGVNPSARIAMQYSGTSGSSLLFGTSNSSVSGITNTAMIINPSGNVGIGTTSPGYKLDVGGTINATAIYQNGVPFSSGNSQWATSGANISYNSGNVGIGTTSPGYKLDVGGTINATAIYQNGSPFSGSQWTTSASNISYSTGNVGIGGAASTASTVRLKVYGDVDVTGVIYANYQDVAEWVPSPQAIPAATVVVLDTTKSNQVIPSLQAYDTRVAGVISVKPGIALGERSEGKVLVATTGRVKVKVDATRAPIHVGDLLVTSEKEGLAMKSEPLDLGGVPIHRPGTLIGKALEPLEKGTGEILVLLSLQ